MVSVAGSGALPPEVLAERLMLAIYAYGTNTDIRAVIPPGGSHSEEDVRYARRRYLTVPVASAIATALANATFAARDSDLWGAASTAAASDSTHYSWASPRARSTTTSPTSRSCAPAPRFPGSSTESSDDPRTPPRFATPHTQLVYAGQSSRSTIWRLVPISLTAPLVGRAYPGPGEIDPPLIEQRENCGVVLGRHRVSIALRSGNARGGRGVDRVNAGRCGGADIHDTLAAATSHCAR